MVSLLGLGGATLQVFFESTRPYLLVLTGLSLAYSFFLVYRRRFRPPALVRRIWITAILAALLSAVPLFRG